MNKMYDLAQLEFICIVTAGISVYLSGKLCSWIVPYLSRAGTALMYSGGVLVLSGLYCKDTKLTWLGGGYVVFGLFAGCVFLPVV